MTMRRRDEFKQATKDALAKRVGYQCSYPGCRAITVGPSTESETSSSNIGIACHIYGAGGPQSPRFQAQLTAEEKKSPGNGIWMCAIHGKLIDDDEVRFTGPMLKQWREIAVRKASCRISRTEWSPVKLKDVDLCKTDCTIFALVGENKQFGDVLHDSCVSDVWGEAVEDAIRDVAIEVARNAFEHGSATRFSLQVTSSQIRMIDDGQEFDPFACIDIPVANGGAAALGCLVNKFGGSIVCEYLFEGGQNILKISFIRSKRDVLSMYPCGVEARFADFRRLELSTSPPSQGCRRVVIALPDYISPSDVGSVASIVARFKSADAVYLVIDRVSMLVLERLAAIIPNVTIVGVPPAHWQG